MDDGIKPLLAVYSCSVLLYWCSAATAAAAAAVAAVLVADADAVMAANRAGTYNFPIILNTSQLL